MIFYVITGNEGVIGCTFAKGTAVKAAKAEGHEGTYVMKVELSCSPREAIRRLLGESGGYSKNTEVVYEVKAP